MISWISRSSWWLWISATVRQVRLTITVVVKEWVVAQAKLNWALKLYDVDNDGVIDLGEMAVIMETMDDIDGVRLGKISKETREKINKLFQERFIMTQMVILNLFQLPRKEQLHFFLLLTKIMTAAWLRRSSWPATPKGLSSWGGKMQMTRKGSWPVWYSMARSLTEKWIPAALPSSWAVFWLPGLESRLLQKTWRSQNLRCPGMKDGLHSSGGHFIFF